MIVNHLAEIMGRRRMRTMDLSRLTGIRSSSISGLWQDKAREISFANMDKLCRVLGCSVGELFEYQPDADCSPVDDGQTVLFAENQESKPDFQPVPEEQVETANVQVDSTPVWKQAKSGTWHLTARNSDMAACQSYNLDRYNPLSGEGVPIVFGEFPAGKVCKKCLAKGSK